MTGRLFPSPGTASRPPRQSHLLFFSGLRFGDDDPALVPGDRLRFLDEHDVANLAGVVLVMRLVLLGRAHDLLHLRMGEASLDLHDDRLLVLVADDGALQNALWHGLFLMPSWPKLFRRRWS